jgi:predicted acyltransferase
MTDVSTATFRPAPGGRLLSIDIARGITIAFMIMVNSSGAAPYAQLKHSSWSGWTAADLVFPSFLLLVGTSIVLSLSRRLEAGTDKPRIAGNILKRTVLLFAFGVIVNGFPYFNLAHLRIYGVLQRIAICYAAAALLYLWRQRAGTIAAVTIFLLVGYYVLLRFVPVPGAGVPTRDIPLLDQNLNWVAWVDRKLMYGRLYEGLRDPEGLLSDLPAIASTLVGVLAGMWLQSNRTRTAISRGLLSAAVVLIALGELWNVVFPINKKLWTSSYVLFAGGCALLLVALLYWSIDVKGMRRAWERPWIVFGTNAIFAYMFSELLASSLWAIHLRGHVMLWTWIYDRLFRQINPPGVGSLCYSIVFAAVCWLATYVLWKRRIFLKV